MNEWERRAADAAENFRRGVWRASTLIECAGCGARVEGKKTSATPFGRLCDECVAPFYDDGAAAPSA